MQKCFCKADRLAAIDHLFLIRGVIGIINRMESARFQDYSLLLDVLENYTCF